MIERPFILIFTCVDPWNEISKVIIPDEIFVLSGLRGIKRKRGDREALFVSEKSFWIIIDDEKLEFEISHPSLRGFKAIPIPKLKGKLGKDFVKLLRDPNLLFPLFFARVEDGFIFSPNENLLKHFSIPESLDDVILLDSDFATIQLKRVIQKRKIKDINELAEAIANELNQLRMKVDTFVLGEKGVILEKKDIKSITEDELFDLNPQKTILIYDISSREENIRNLREEYYKLFLRLWPFPIIPLGYIVSIESLSSTEIKQFWSTLKNKLKI